MKKLLSIIIMLAVTLSVTTFAFAEDNSSVGATGSTVGNTAVKANTAIPQEILDKRAQLKTLYDEAKSIRGELIALQGQVRSKLVELRTELKNLPKEDRAAAREHLKLLNKNISAERSEAEVLRSQLKSETVTMQAFRAQLKVAIKAKDFGKAATILDGMISQKTTKNADLNKLLDIRNSMLNEFQK
jgi:TolA-binding protein